MIRYQISTGFLYAVEGEATRKIGSGYSGAFPYINDPDGQAVRFRGPIPSGRYRVARPFDHSRLGPVVFFLDPIELAQMKGRSGFFIHGDNSHRNRTASSGCIIMDRPVRDRLVELWERTTPRDRILEVVE